MRTIRPSRSVKMLKICPSSGSSPTDAVYQTYSTTWRGFEFLTGYYPILDRAPKGRDEGEAWQLWIRPRPSRTASYSSRTSAVEIRV